VTTPIARYVGLRYLSDTYAVLNTGTGLLREEKLKSFPKVQRSNIQITKNADETVTAA